MTPTEPRSAAEEFWVGEHRYEDLVREYERNVETVSPPSIRTRDWGWSRWLNTKVKYRKYRGPSVKNL